MIMDTITSRRKRKTITDFYTRITFSITIRSSSINSSNSDILSTTTTNHKLWLSLLENFVQNTVLLSCALSYICSRYQLKNSPIIIFPFNSTRFFIFMTKKQNPKTILLTTYYSRKIYDCMLHTLIVPKEILEILSIVLHTVVVYCIITFLLCV